MPTALATEIGIWRPDIDHVVQAKHTQSAGHCRSVVCNVRPRAADVRGWRRETCLKEGSALLSSCLPLLTEA